MAESNTGQKPGTSDYNIRKIVGRLTVFCKCFVETFETKIIELKKEAAVGGTPKQGKKGNTLINIIKVIPVINNPILTEVTSQSVRLAAADHRSKSKKVNDNLRQVNDNDNFRKILVEAAGEIFYCYQNQFMLVTNDALSWQIGMEKLATDAVDRVINFIKTDEGNSTIDEASFHEFITKGVVFGESKNRNVKYNGIELNTKKIYEGVGFVNISDDNCTKYFLKNSSKVRLVTIGYRFLFTWETFDEFKEKIYSSREEHVIKCDLTEKTLKEELKVILDSINSGDILYISKETKRDTNIMKVKIDNVDKNVNELKPKIENTQLDIMEVKACINEQLKPTIEKVEAKVDSLVQSEESKNHQHKKDPIWFDMREPVITFTGRTEVLEDLHKKLQNAARSAVISQTTSVSGLGGIGKSELSRKYAIKYQDAYDNNLIWINSETQDSLKDSFTRLAKKLKIPVIEKDTEQKEKLRDVASITEDVYTRFGTGKSLFIFDNAEKYEIIKEFLPFSLPSQKPHILITSRNQDWNAADTGDVCVINLNYFTSKESLDFIKKALKIPTKNNSGDNELKDLGNQLGNFPLALGQAAAYIQMKNESATRHGKKKFEVKDYLKEFQVASTKVQLLKHRHENSQYNKTVLTTWNVTLENIKEENEDSIKIIEIMAYLVPDSIKPGIVFSNLIRDEKMREKATDLLVQYSMVNIKWGVLSIHRLVQEVIRLQLKDQSREKDVLENALELLGFEIVKNVNSYLLSVWSYACDHGEIINKFFFEYKSLSKNTLFHSIVKSDDIDTVRKILNHFKTTSNEKLHENLKSMDYYDYIENHLKQLRKILNYEKALSISSKQNSLEMIKLLIIEFGAEKDTKTCVEIIFNGCVEIVEYLYPNNDEYLLNAKFYSALLSKDVKSLNNLLENLTNEQIKNIFEQKLTKLDRKFITHPPPLYYAAKNGNLEIVKLFIKYKANANFRKKSYRKILLNGVLIRKYELCKILIENGANCNQGDEGGRTVLHYATQSGQLEMLKYLIENNKCDINATNNWSATALHLAAEMGHLDIVKYLIETNKCVINATNNWSARALHLAAEMGHLDIVKYLIETNKCDVNATNINGETALHLAADRGHLNIVKYLIETNKCDLNATDIEGRTVLHYAALSGRLEIVKYLIENNKCDINATDKEGRTALHFAAQFGKLEIMKYLIENNKCDINATDKEGRTALHLAASRGKLEIVKYLIENNKCDINATNKEGETALDLAIENYELEMVEYLTKINNEINSINKVQKN